MGIRGMKLNSEFLLYRSLSFSLLLTSLLSFPSFAEESSYLGRVGDSVAASMGLSNVYLFRGYDHAADSKGHVYGDLSIEPGLGFYGSTWLSNSERGGEYDLIAGWRKAFGNKLINVGVVNYVYYDDPLADGVGDEVEAFIGFHWADFQAYYYDNVSSRYAQNEDYFYLTFAYTYQSFGATLGYAQDHSIYGTGIPGVYSGKGGYDYSHLDLSYAYSPNLTFTLSQLLQRSADYGGADIQSSDFGELVNGGEFNGYSHPGDLRYRPIETNSLMIVVTYSVPIEF